MLTSTSASSNSSSLALALAAPLIGLAYVVLLPIIGITATVVLAGRRLMAGMFHATGKCVSFGWRPGSAYLSGKKKKSNKEQ